MITQVLEEGHIDMKMQAEMEVKVRDFLRKYPKGPKASAEAEEIWVGMIKAHIEYGRACGVEIESVFDAWNSGVAKIYSEFEFESVED